MKPKSLAKPSPFDQDGSKLKKPKSAKRKRRYSSSSDSDSAHTSTKKNKKNKKKKKKKPRKSTRKKLPRKVSISPTSCSYSSDHSLTTCSTCDKRKPTRSPSPISRTSSKSKVRGKSSKYKARERGRSRRRTSPSSSTCGERSRSRSPKRTKRLHKHQEKSRLSNAIESDDEEREKVIPSYDDVVSPSKSKDVEENHLQRGTAVAEDLDKAVPVKTQNETGVVDVELILRQKALENFIKFHKVKKCGITEERGKAVSDEPNEEVGSVPGAVATGMEVQEPSVDEPTKEITDMDLKGKGEIVLDISVKRPKLRSVIIVPTEREVGEDNTTIGIKEVLGRVEEEPDKGSEPNPNLNSEVPDPSSLVVTGLRKVETISGAVDQSGAQYEKKTFSRMRDGESVEVNYKVYIPKKAPALARRKLQRGETSTS